MHAQARTATRISVTSAAKPISTYLTISLIGFVTVITFVVILDEVKVVLSSVVIVVEGGRGVILVGCVVELRQ